MRCRFGWHKWGLWFPTSRGRYDIALIRKQARECYRCKRVKTRLTGL